MTTAVRKSPYRWVVLAIYMYVSALSLLFWVNFAAIETYMEEQLHFSSHQIVWLAQVFLIIFFILAVPSGLFIDKKGFKKGIGLGVLLTGIFPLIRLLNPTSFPVLLISQIGIAIGQPFILNGITKIVAAWFPPDEEGTAIGLASLAQPLGMVIAFGATSQLVQRFSFEFMLVTYSIMALIGVFTFFFLVKPAPRIPVRKEESRKREAFYKEIAAIIKIKNFNILSFIVLILFAVISGLLTRLEKIMHDLHGFSLTDSGNLVAIFLLGSVAGSMIIPIISDKIKRRKPLLALCIIMTILCFPISIYIHGYAINLLNGVILGFFLSATVPLMYTISVEITGASYAGISVGYLQLLGCFSSSLIVPAMQMLWILSGSFVTSLYFIIVLLIIALALAIWLRETYPLAKKKIVIGKN